MRENTNAISAVCWPRQFQHAERLGELPIYARKCPCGRVASRAVIICRMPGAPSGNRADDIADDDAHRREMPRTPDISGRVVDDSADTDCQARKYLKPSMFSAVAREYLRRYRHDGDE